MSQQDNSRRAPPYVRVMAPILPVVDVFVARLRTAAVKRLQLRPGDAVLDAGCGTGSNFGRLLAAVGPRGRVVGVEIDATLAEGARRRIRRHGWQNVELIESAAESARLEGQYNGLLLFGAHEIVTSPQALDNLFACLKSGARVVALGARTRQTLPGRLAKPLLSRMSRNWLPDSPPIGDQPWRLLLERVEGLEVEGRALGLMYLVTGTVLGKDVHE